VKIRRSVRHVLLSLLLLLSQQMGIAHAVSHLSDARQQTSQDKQLPVEQTCEQCLAYAQIGSGLTSAAVLPLVQAVVSLVIDNALTQYFSPRTVYAFQSRAPPQ
jgi:hypothetical protein